MSEGEVLDVEREMSRLLEDIPIGLILEDEETLETENLLERGGAMQAVASQQYINANGEGEGSKGKTAGTLARGCPF